MKFNSVKENPEFKDRAIKYFQSKWASEQSMMVYEDCITHCVTTSNPLPQWYLFSDKGTVLAFGNARTVPLFVLLAIPQDNPDKTLPENCRFDMPFYMDNKRERYLKTIYFLRILLSYVNFSKYF